MDNNGGITAQKYFVYQKAIFVILAFKKLSGESEIVYEGLDDIDFSNVLTKNSHFQVKGGKKLTLTGIYDVLTNWLNIFKTNKNLSFCLFCENAPSVLFKDLLFENYYKYCLKHKGEKITSKYSLLFSNYTTEKDLRESFSEIIAKIEETQIIPISSLDEKLLSSYQQYVGSNFKSLDKQRAVKISNEIFILIENNILFSSSTSLTIGTFNKIINQVNETLPAELYNFKSSSFLFDKAMALELIKKADSRLVNELIKVNSQTEFLVNEIRNEMEYEFFRDTYLDDFEDDIISIEEKCFSNYKRLLFNPKIHSSQDLYFEFGYFNNPSRILHDSTDARYGCANFLASDQNKNEEIRISWER